MRKMMTLITALVLVIGFVSFRATPARGSDDGIFNDRLTVTATSKPGSVLLEWTDPRPGGVTGYIIRRGPAPGQEDRWPVSDFPVTGTSYTDRNVVPGDSYYYVVIPLLGDGTMRKGSAEVTAVAGEVPDGYRFIQLHMDTDVALLTSSEGTRRLALHGKPVLDRGRVLLPLTDIVDLLHADVSYDPETGAITHRLPTGQVMEMAVGNCCLTFGKAARQDTCSPLKINGQIYLPLRWIAETLLAEVTFEADMHTVTVEMEAAQ